MIRAGDPVILKFAPNGDRALKRFNGKAYTYESMANAVMALGPGEKDALLMEYVPAPVRCKDCKFYKQLSNEVDKEWGVCSKINVPATHPDQFCSWGERRD